MDNEPHHPESTESYTYQPLKSAPAEIRVLILHAGSGNDPIQCTLFHVEFAGADYQAMSYVWGPPSDVADEKVIINGLLHSKPLQRNLRQRLLEIRDESHDILLWIDALCINQEDPKEKGHQVAMMGDIFKKAGNVIVWLGPAADNSHLAMEMIANRTWATRSSTESERDCERNALLALTRRPYWRRVWVIQEFQLARRYEVKCDSHVVGQQNFEDCLIWAHDAPECHDFTSLNPAYQHQFRRELSTVPQLNTLWRWIMTCISCRFEASDERDYVYALIGVSHDCRNGEIASDYGGTTRDAFLKTAPLLATQRRMTRRDFVQWGGWFAEKLGLVFDDDLQREFLDRRGPGFDDGALREIIEHCQQTTKSYISSCLLLGSIFFLLFSFFYLPYRASVETGQ